MATEVDKKRWKVRRSYFNPSFNRQFVSTSNSSSLLLCLSNLSIERSLIIYMKEFNIKADMLMERLRTLADGKTQVKMAKEFNRAVFDIIASVIIIID